MSAMNEYGLQAMRHYQRWLPEQFDQIEDPESHFATLGEQAADRIFEIEDEIFRNGTPSEDYLIEVGRRNMARMTAREMVLAELLPAPPDEDVVGHPLEQDPTYLAREERISAAMDTQGMPRDESHPLWADMDNDAISPSEFQRRWDQWYRSLLTP